jgi:serine/threonine protein kinase
MPICPKCGATYPAGVQWCTSDGTKLATDLAAAVAEARSEGPAPISAAPEDGSSPSVTEAPTTDAIFRELKAGTKVGEYVINGIIGAGGMGTVYSGTHPVIGKRVAVKVLKPAYAADHDVVARFIDEARSVNRIGHRNIIDIFNFGRLSDGRHYFVMEYLDGRSLKRYLKDHGPLSFAELKQFVVPICQALGAAHSAGVVHRDLKPDNIYIVEQPDQPPFVKLLDFGVAKLLTAEENQRTRTGVPIGTPDYMSPEQCRGRGVDHRSDIYSLGIVMYRMMTGRVPFKSDSFIEIVTAHIHQPLETIDVSQIDPLAVPIILKALAKEPSERQQSAAEVVMELEWAQQRANQSGAPPFVPPPGTPGAGPQYLPLPGAPPFAPLPGGRPMAPASGAAHATPTPPPSAGGSRPKGTPAPAGTPWPGTGPHTPTPGTPPPSLLHSEETALLPIQGAPMVPPGAPPAYGAPAGRMPPPSPGAPPAYGAPAGRMPPSSGAPAGRMPPSSGAPAGRMPPEPGLERPARSHLPLVIGAVAAVLVMGGGTAAALFFLRSGGSDGALEVTSTPPGASVIVVDKKQEEPTPLVVRNLRRGAKVPVVLTMDGYKSWGGQGDVPARGNGRLAVVLEPDTGGPGPAPGGPAPGGPAPGGPAPSGPAPSGPAPSGPAPTGAVASGPTEPPRPVTGEIKVRSAVPATIFLDGKQIGEAATSEVVVPAAVGKHQLRAKADGYDEAVVRVVVEAGKTVESEIKLKKKGARARGPARDKDAVLSPW